MASAAKEDGAQPQGEVEAYSKPNPDAAHPTLSADNFLVVHDTKWHEQVVLRPVGILTPRRSWSVCSCTGETVV